MFAPVAVKRRRACFSSASDRLLLSPSNISIMDQQSHDHKYCLDKSQTPKLAKLFLPHVVIQCYSDPHTHRGTDRCDVIKERIAIKVCVDFSGDKSVDRCFGQVSP